MSGNVQHLNPAGLHQHPTSSHVVGVSGRVKTASVGGRNANRPERSSKPQPSPPAHADLGALETGALCERRSYLLKGLGYALQPKRKVMSKAITFQPHNYPIMEFRRYTLHPGRRETLINLFEREFISAQENVGIYLNGHFRNLDDPDQFVWMRSFPDMAARKRALEAFYFGPVWQAHRDAANATMIDSDNVFLLRPARVGSGFSESDAWQLKAGSLVVAEIYSLAENHAVDHTDGFATFFGRDLEPVLRSAGAATLAAYVTEPSENTFPRLPVRTDTAVFIWFSRFDDEAAYATYRRALGRTLQEQDDLAQRLASWLRATTESLRLSPINLVPASLLRPS